MFNHPEGQSHPKPPSHLKKVKRYEFGESIFGKSPRFIESFLKKENQLKDLAEISLAKQIRSFIYKKTNRKEYVTATNNYLKNKKIRKKKDYDIVLVGAGIHSAVYLYSLRKKTLN